MEKPNHTQTVLSGLTAQRRHDAIYWCLLLVACAAFLVMNVLTTLKEDDMGFTLVDGEWTPIQSLADLLRSHYNHYVATNGRTADLFALLFCSVFGKMVFNVCNTVVFGLLAHLVSLLATGRRSVLALTAVVACVGTCYPVPGETMLWLAGSCNYIWAVTASLLLVYYLLHHQGKTLGWGRGVLLLLGAVVAGSFNEATSIGFLAGLGLYYAFNRERFDRTAALALVGYLIGVALIMASPAAWERASSGGIVVNLEFNRLLSTRWFIFSEKMWRYLTPVVALVIGVGTLLARRGRTVKQCVWTYVFLCLALELLALGIIHERAYAPLATVALIIVVMAADALLARWPMIRLAVIAAVLALAAFTWGRGIVVLNEYKAFNDQVVSEIKEAPRQAVLHDRLFTGYSRFIKPVNYVSMHYFAQGVVYCGFFDKDNVQFVDDSVYVRYHSGRLLEGIRPSSFVCDRPDVIDSIYMIHGQNYMVAELTADTLPRTFQMARYYMTQPGSGLTAQDAQRRAEYGLDIDYSPFGFYPLKYQGRKLLIFTWPNRYINRIVFPIGMGFKPEEATLIRQD